jgi:chemotaxis signal transduction protein
MPRGDDTVRLLVFRLGAEQFGVELSAVREVVDGPAIRPLPDASDRVLGVIAVREALVTVYDPRSVLGVGDAATGAVLLCECDGGLVGVGVDDVIDTVDVTEPGVQHAPGVDADGVLRGVVLRGRSLIGVLDAHALLMELGIARGLIRS